MADTPQNGDSSDLTDAQHHQKEQILTQPHASHVSTTEAIVLKQGPVSFLTHHNGDVLWPLPHALGLFFQDCRFLDGYTLTINGQSLVALSSMQARGFETEHYLTNPSDLPDLTDDGGTIGDNVLKVRRQRIIRGHSVFENLDVENFGPVPVHLSLELRFRAEFEDIFVLKGFVSGPRGKLHRPKAEGKSRITFRYDGRDHLTRTTEVSLDPSPTEISGGRARFDFALRSRESRQLHIRITPSVAQAGDPPTSDSNFSAASVDPRHWLDRQEAAWLQRSTKVRSSNPLFDRVLQRALLDLRILRAAINHRQYFAAGVPWFVTLFGRDSAICAIQSLPYQFAVARSTLRLLANYQARDFDAYRDAQPGKILHELRMGELAHMDKIPQSPAYYGTVDATMLFLILACEYVSWSGDLDLARELLPHLEAALSWIDRYGDSDGDGYVDYAGRYENGLVNQGWKDSGNAIVNADGSLAEPPIALCEVQAYTFRAWRQMAILFDKLDMSSQANDLRAKSESLKDRFEHDFWDDEMGCYVLALQKGRRPAAVVSSNAGQVLWGGIAAPEHASRVAQRLMKDDMYSGWGIRTLSARANAYNPMSYHLGSVWPHDNDLMLTGFRRYGHDSQALRVFDGLFAAAANFTDYRLPELFCGLPRGSEQHPVQYPTACRPQAWAAGALPHALWNLLGLRPDAVRGLLRIVQPQLPEWLQWVTLDNMRIGSATVDLRFERTQPGEPVEAQWLVRDGHLQVERRDEIDAETW